jgi:putative ABC transport system substrate-binding protein
VTAVWPLAGRAQQTAMPVVGFLGSVSPGPLAHLVSAFRTGLNEVGYVEGQSVAIECRWSEGQHDHLPALATALVQWQVAVIVLTGGGPSALAAEEAKATIPVVIAGGGDPMRPGLADSLNRPGGNATGLPSLSSGWS